jgi:hypothetical protein
MMVNEDGQSSDGCWMLDGDGPQSQTDPVQSASRVAHRTSAKPPTLHSTQALSTEAVAATWHIKVSVLFM